MDIIHAHVRQEWHWVRPGLETIIRRNKAYYLSEDIYHRILNGELSLYVNEERNAFAVLRMVSRHTTGETGVYIVALFTEPGMATDEALTALSALAVKSGATYLEMDSRRKGFARTGWDQSFTIYTRSL